MSSAMKMRDIMSAAPVCMAPGESAFAAAQAMRRHDTGTVLVLAGDRIRGLVTDRDIALLVLAEDGDPRTTAIGDMCDGELAALGPDDDLDAARRLVLDCAARRIPVLENGIAVGVVSVGDLALAVGPAPCAWSVPC